MSYLVTAAITVGGSLLAGKIARNTANDPKAAIGTGTAPALQPGGDIQVTPVGGSQVKDFGDFGSENMLEPEDMTEEEKLMAMLQESGVNLEGLTSMAYGGPVQYKANGSGIASLDRLNIDPELLEQLLSGRNPLGETINTIDFESGIVENPSLADTMENQINDTTRTELLASIDPQIRQEQHLLQRISNYTNENPEMAKAGIGALRDVALALMADQPKAKGSIVSTQTLPGNSNRRRNNLENITPIGGSKVTFANKGSALQRPMFMPQGGQMRGPGGPKDDLIPVMASNGEYMLSKAAVDAAGNGSHAQGLAKLEAFNKMGNQRYG